MTRTITALATAATLAFAPAAFAEAHVSMGAGYDMLVAGLEGDFERLGIDTDLMDNLTLSQLAAIKSVLESQDDDNQELNQIEAIIANN
jgi:hypothetical protein